MERPKKLEGEDALVLSLKLLEKGRALDADALLTAALVGDGGNSDLWMAAGIARTMRGHFEHARQAFRMCAWIGGDPVAREMAGCL